MKVNYKESGVVAWHETDLHKRLRLSALFNRMQEAAAVHADSLGFGYKILEKENRFWALSRMIVELEDDATPGDIINIETWPSGTDKLFAFRDFLIFNGEKSLVLRARSSWLILDSIRKRPLRVDGLYELPNENLQEVSMSIFPEKIDFSASTISRDGQHMEAERKVEFSDVDQNGHMNNARYIVWLEDMLGDQLISGSRIIRVEVNYLKEIAYGQTTRLSLSILQKRDQNSTEFEFGIFRDDMAAFLARGLMK